MDRYIVYDGLRGWLLIIITCNHLYGNFIPQITRAPLGLVSAAEGFVFLSGFIAYLVYSRYSEDSAKLKTKIWRRCWTIYSFHILAITLTFTLVGILPIYVSQWSGFFNAANWFVSPTQSYFLALLLLEQPGYHDILVLYLVPMILLPFAISAIKRGNATRVAAISVFIWLVSQFVTVQWFTPLLGLLGLDISANVSYFNPFSWQIYFYMGVLLSYLKYDKNIKFSFPLSIKVFLLSLLGGIVLIKHTAPELMQPYVYGSGSASLVYQFNLLLVIYLFMLLMRSVPFVFTLKYPVFLGQHALPVFSFHTIVIYFLQPFSQPYTLAYWYWDLLTCLFFLALLALPAKMDQIWRASKLRNQFTQWYRLPS
ncbi:hypothetical protein EAG18_12475 [Pseudoalteromonas sp. J010]|uniref:OpgC domain-containing protein n=1 Tax=Pseudoalteromonas sp. J010 TaxID=998465 RepID=UPI000F64B748|nr:OpgC domain-containing protein [Pseudoalteromonas sp. J010]RRS08277.1 hypothetical protein EAG18_12475 [Pseudoalteromonas sp. J010]